MKTKVMPLLGCLLAAPVVLADTTALPFTVTITPKSGGQLDFKVLNESTEPITGILVEKESLTAGSVRFSKLADNCLSSGTAESPAYLSATNGVGVIREVRLTESGEPVKRTRIKNGSFEAPMNSLEAYQWERMHGYLTVPETGYYRFGTAADDKGRLYCQTNASLGKMTLNAFDAWTGGVDKFCAWSQVLYLTQGQVIYLDAWCQDTGGQDYLRVRWQWVSPSYYSMVPTAPSFFFDFYFSLLAQRTELIPMSRFNLAASGWPAIETAPIGDGTEASYRIRIRDINTLNWGDEYAFVAFFESKSAAGPVELWNLATGRIKTTVTVFGAYGNTETVTLEPTASTQLGIPYVFRSVNRPLKLTVRSVDEDGNALAAVNHFTVSVEDPTRQVPDNKLIETNNPERAFFTHQRLRKGMQVKVTAPQAVYFGKDGGYLFSETDSTLIQTNAYMRYRMAGMSIHGQAAANENPQYQAELQQDLTVDIKWVQEFALRVNQDFRRTASTSRTEQGTPWVGPLTSGAAGSPTHDATVLHWIAKNAELVDAIDPAIEDTTYSGVGLRVRYVPYEYVVEGSALGTYWSPDATIRTNKFVVSQQMTGRQQIGVFRMTGWGGITYRWKVQYGVTVSTLLGGGGGGNLGRIYATDELGVDKLVGALDSTYWFDEGTHVKVMAQANTGGTVSKALTGWSLGDDYYFTLGGGTIDTQSGTLSGGSAIKTVDGSPVARWLASATMADAPVLTFRGLDIPVLERPVSVSWSYGTQVYYDPSVPIGEAVFQGMENVLPAAVLQRVQSGAPTQVDDPSAVVWDANAGKLYPVKPKDGGGDYTAKWEGGDLSVEVRFKAVWPPVPHYRHVADTPPVQLTPDPAGSFFFKEISYTENSGAVSQTSLFTAGLAGKTVLRFGEVKKIGRGEPKEYVRLRVVETRTLQDVLQGVSVANALIGRAVRDPLDLANLGTGYLAHQDGVRYNAAVYNRAALDGLRATAVYDMARLRQVAPEKVVLHPEALPGPVFPVNRHPGVQDANRITVVWYDDPTKRDGILWPYAARKYQAVWPSNAAEGLGRIVIATEFGSESLSASGVDQVVAPATNGVPAAAAYHPSRFSDLKVYAQNDPALPGYNPNEEHALIAPSLRYADVSPRPNAVYALRNNDLNNLNSVYTSDPYVLVQFYDTLLRAYGMRVYQVVREDAALGQLDKTYTFPPRASISKANQDREATVNVDAAAAALQNLRHKEMEAGEPVIPFYPLGVVEGAVPSPESFGQNIKGQLTFWKDHKATRWAVSGGTNAWFTVSAFYPLQGDFWWPADNAAKVNVGDRLPFLPVSLTLTAPANDLPAKILYKSDWPKIAPVLKAGETLTYSGGEYRADRPTIVVEGKTVQTPGLPAVLAFATANVVFDAMNPSGAVSGLTNRWTVRAAEVMVKREVELRQEDFPDALKPASGKSRESNGKYVFKDLPASLQKRVVYDPVEGNLELRGFVNEKSLDDSTLTASPGAVYVLEPNILTDGERGMLSALDSSPAWAAAVDELYNRSRNPSGLADSPYGNGAYSVGLQPKVDRDAAGNARLVTNEVGVISVRTLPEVAEPAVSKGPGIALIPNGAFLDPLRSDYPEVSWVTVAENNDPSMGGSPVTLHIIKVDRRERYRGAIKTVLSGNVFDENVVLRHTGDFGANADDLVYEWWYRPDDGALNVPPPFSDGPSAVGDWKLFPDLSGKNGLGRNEVLLKGDPNAPEALLADSWWFARYRHKNDTVQGSNWAVMQPDNSPEVNYEWAGAGNSDPFHDYDLDGYMDYRAQLSMGWIKRVLDAVNPYEARITDFTGDAPITSSSMLQQLGPRYEGAVALNPDKNVVENVGLIELYQTVLNRASDLSINLSTPVSTPAIANALQLASTRLSDFYTLLGNEAYVDAKDPTIGYGSSSVEYGAAAPAVFAFQNQVSSLLEEELVLLRGQDDNMARPVYNRMFWNFTKGEGEAAYAMNYNISDINMDGFIDEDDAMTLYPQGHGDAWGHYLTALTRQYDLLRHPYFNWVSRSEFYNLMDIVMKVDFLDERKFAQIAAQKAQAGAEIVNDTYREHYVEDETAQWQGYTDVNRDRAWGVQDWARRAGQGAYFDWLTANALLPAVHPNTTLTGIQKVDRQENADIAVISANLNQIQTTLDNANGGLNPLGLSSKAVPFDINPYSWEDGVFGRTHFEQIYDRAVAALNNAKTAWDTANAAQNRLRAVANTEQEFRNDVYQQNIAYRNQLIEIFGRPYPGTVGAGKFYPDSYLGPDITFYMYVGANSTAYDKFPKPAASAVAFDASGKLVGGTLKDVLDNSKLLSGTESYRVNANNLLARVSMLFGDIGNTTGNAALALAADGLYDMSANDFNATNNPLEDLDFALPVSASTYSLLAPEEWGERPAVGELQTVIADMLQQQIAISSTMGSYADMWIDLYRAINLMTIQYEVQESLAKRQQDWLISKSIIKTVLTGVKTVLEILEETEDTITTVLGAAGDTIPRNLPTGGLAISPGDALAPVAASFKLTGATVSAGLGAAGIAAKIVEFINEAAMEIAGDTVEMYNADDERRAAYAELIAGVDDMLDEEGDMRAEIFAQSEQLRSLAERYRTILSKGSLLMDEREAFNKRVAAMVQQNRYQDMTFRVQRNHALQNYNKLLDIAARYVYLAAKAYDYETNFAADDPGSPSALFGEISRARTIGLVDGSGAPQLGDGLAGILAQLATNYGALKGQLGLTNPQVETGKLSLRSEKFRVFPSGYTPSGDTSGWCGQADADQNWKEVLSKARVKNLWDVPEFRFAARPFASEVNADGTRAVEPGIVLRFSTEVSAGKNVFGRPLAGGDHAYDPSVYANRIRSVGVWFSNYRSSDVLTDLSAAPRVYLIPTGVDVMSIPNASSPEQVRVWNVVDQTIPVPVSGIGAKLPYSKFVPLLDSLDGRIGLHRRFSSFRAYHDEGDAVNTDELVSDSRLVGRSVWNTGWTLIVPGRTLNADPDEGLDRFIDQVSDIKLVFETYGFSGN
jgi:hypothetical protein